MEKLAYNVAEAATLLGIGKNKAWELVNAGELPSIRFGRRVLIPRAALERMLADVEAAPVRRARE